MAFHIRNFSASRALFQAAQRFHADERGVTAIEYAMIGAMMSIMIAGAVTDIGQTIMTVFYDKLTAVINS